MIAAATARSAIPPVCIPPGTVVGRKDRIEQALARGCPARASPRKRTRSCFASAARGMGAGRHGPSRRDLCPFANDRRLK
jgi:ribosome modulation factor